jgi:alginate biosynthesis protein AlgK
MTRRLTMLALPAVLLTACTAPDLGRGKKALEAGDTEAAQRDLAPLAQMGYEDARMQLARAYARSGDPAKLQAAVQMYQEIVKQDPTVRVPLARMLLESGDEKAIGQAEEMLLLAHRDKDPRATVALLELYSDHPERDGHKRAPGLAAAVSKMTTPDAEAASVKWYRRNALVDARYAKELIRHCELARNRLPDCYVDLGRHYRATGNEKALRTLVADANTRFALGHVPVPVLEKLGWSMVSEDIAGNPLPEAAQPILKRAAETSDTARVRLARLLIEYPHLDPQGRPEELLLKAAGRGNREASLALGRLYLDGKLAPADPGKAIKYLEQAADTEPAAHYYLGRIYKRGYLGRPDPVLAARYFLTAARGGYARADQALAQLFSDNRGVKPNLVNAYVFASIAAERQTPEGALMLKQVRAMLKPGQQQQAEQLLRQELAIRQAEGLPVRAFAAMETNPPKEVTP